MWFWLIYFFWKIRFHSNCFFENSLLLWLFWVTFAFCFQQFYQHMPKYGYLFTLWFIRLLESGILVCFISFVKFSANIFSNIALNIPLSFSFLFETLITCILLLSFFLLFLFPLLLMYIFYLCFFSHVSFWIFSFGLSSNLLNNNLQVSGKSLTHSTPSSKHHSSPILSAIWTKGLLLLLLIWVYIYHHWNPAFSVHPYSIKSKPISMDREETFPPSSLFYIFDYFICLIP